MPTTATTIAATTPTTPPFPVYAVGTSVSFEERNNGVPSVEKVTVQSAQWSMTRGPAGGEDPGRGAYLIVTVRVDCVTGVCRPGAGSFIFGGIDGRLYYSLGPGGTGYVPALGFGKSAYQPDLSTPIAAGQSVTGIAAIDAPRIPGVVYLVGLNATTTVTVAQPPNLILNGAVAGFSITA